MPRKRFTAIAKHMHDPEIPKLATFDRASVRSFKEFFVFFDVFVNNSSCEHYE
jgi:hypothetical protein